MILPADLRDNHISGLILLIKGIVSGDLRNNHITGLIEQIKGIVSGDLRDYHISGLIFHIKGIESGDLTVSVPTVSMRTIFYGNIRDIDSFLVSRAGLATILLTTRQPDKILYGFFDML